MKLAMDGSLPELVEKYVRTWDARSEGSLVDRSWRPTWSIISPSARPMVWRG
jgi:hypothetical protein